MISNWRLENFKSIACETVPLRPLTVISGINSSGKSTILQSMALVAQTLSNQLEQEPLLLNGHLMSLGTFKNVCSANSADHRLSIGWDIEPRDAPAEETTPHDLASIETYATHNVINLRRVRCDVTFCGPGRPQVLQGALSVESLAGTPTTIEWMQAPDQPAGKASWRVCLNEETYLRQRHAVPDSARCELRHFLPSRLLLEVQTEARDAELRALVLCQKRRVHRISDHPLLTCAVPERVAERLVDILPADERLVAPSLGTSFANWTTWLAEVCSRRAELTPKLNAMVSDVLELLTEQASAKTLAEHTHLPGGLPDAVFYLETFFATKFRYLGPLRDEPRAIYPYPTKLDPVDLGRRGEYTAAAYHAYADVLVRHVEYKELVEYGPVASERTATLKAAVDEWLRYLGVAEHLVSKEDKYGHVLGVGTVRGTGGSDWEMIHVGTGVSQVLPILVLGLLAQSDSTLVIEHPELHLHPGAQARLADFFLFLALTGRQIIVETHSEYILHRLRRRIVGPEGEALRSEIGILFAGVENGATSFREVSINEYGAIEEWPEGFFDAAAVETEGILRAAIEKETGRRS